ncbi:hypothetical protein [Sphingomonas sp. Root241]|uniref:hypothetical protein n=1 Tax=Sphingomonas sp. Root241 TaxID=1736501 RepID=UPI000AF06BE8|nr:hypothetical protein [Sphingomonas sp. Root241]
MLVSVSFLVRAWDLIWDADPSRAIQENPWSKISGNLVGYVGDGPLRPDNISVNVAVPSEKIIHLHEKNHPNWYNFDDFVCLNFNFTWDEVLFSAARENSIKSGLPASEITEAATRYLGTISNSIAQRFIALANIGIPGLASNRFSAVHSENFYEEGAACGSWLELIYEDSSLYKSKPLKSIPITDCLSWGKSLRGVWSDLPKTNVERAFSYFSHSFYEDFTGHLNGIVWAMGALDAFYCESAVGLSEKIKKRVPKIFNGVDINILKKSLNAIYSDRSRVYHGDVAFPMNFFDPYHEMEESESHLNIFSSLGDLYYIVCGSLQYSVIKGAAEVIFEERVVVR